MYPLKHSETCSWPYLMRFSCFLMSRSLMYWRLSTFLRPRPTPSKTLAQPFLKYNFTPAKIFMGDTGSLIVGLICAILTLTFIEANKGLEHPYAFKAVPAVAIGVMIIPLYDTLRVFTLRILRGKSPFSPDRNHIHHLLIDTGLSHMQATSVLAFFNILFIVGVIFLQDIGSFYLLIVVLTTATVLTTGLY